MTANHSLSLFHRLIFFNVPPTIIGFIKVRDLAKVKSAMNNVGVFIIVTSFISTCFPSPLDLSHFNHSHQDMLSTVISAQIVVLEVSLTDHMSSLLLGWGWKKAAIC